MMRVVQTIELSRNHTQPWLSTLCPDRIVRNTVLLLLTITATLVMCHLMSAAVNKAYPSSATTIVRDFFGLEREGGVTTWFSSLQLALIALTCGGLFVSERAGGLQVKQAVGWLGFASVFLFLSLDETAQVHERLDQVLSAHSAQVGVVTTTAMTTNQAFIQEVGVAAYAYMLLYVPVFVCVLYLINKFLAWRGADRATQRLLLAGFIGFAIKLGLEPFEAWFWQTTWLGHNVMVEIVILQMSALLVGETLILAAFLNYLAGLIRPSVVLSRVA
jgi:hypothetical protein